MKQIFRYFRFHVFLILILALSPILPHDAYGDNVPTGSGSEVYSILKELSDAKYKGRVPGTPQYKQAATYVKGLFKKWGVAPLGVDHLLSYQTNLATYIDQPSMSLDGKPLTILQDFKPHGSSGSGTIKGESILYAGMGYPEDIASLNLKNQIVLMDANTKPDKAMGVADRMILMKNKGAKAVLLLPTRFYPIYSYERPLNGAETGIVSVYIREKLLDTANLKVGDSLVKRIEIHVKIDRKSSVEAQNVVGFVPGKDPHRTVIVSATLDGLGYIPNTAAFQAASMNGSGVAAVLSLARYYQEHQPETNVLFALFGSETTNRDGVTSFLKQYSSLSKAKIIGAYNLFDLGGSEQFPKLYGTATDGSPIAESMKTSQDVAYTDHGVKELYNFTNGVFESKGIPNAFIRGSESIDALKDTIQAINLSALQKHIKTIQGLVDQLMKDPGYALYVSPSSVTPDERGMVYVPEVNHNMSFFSTEYFDVYYEADRWKNPEGLAKKIDKVYEQISWWNYFPQDHERIKVYYTNSYEDNWATAHRTPEPQNKTSGGLQSPDNHSISVVYVPNVPEDLTNSLGTIYHELNHNLVTYKLKELGYGNGYKTEVQEIQGHANNYESQEMGYRALRSSLAGLLQKPLSSISWDRYVTDLEPGKELDTTYNQSASLIFYIYSKYDPEKGREFAYRMYTEDNQPLKTIVKETLGVDFDDFITGWYDWFQGKEVTPLPYKKGAYSPPARSAAGDHSGGTASNSPFQAIAGNIAQGNITSQGLKISSVTVAQKGTDAIFSIAYTSQREFSFLLFDPPNGNQISVRDKVKPGTNKLQVKVPVSKLRSVENLTMNLFDNSSNNFMSIDMNELWKILK